MAHSPSDDYYLYGVSDVIWDFGDEAEGYGEDVSHDYAQPSTYEVFMTVTWADGTMREYRRLVEIG